ncbi:MAG: hypothetical protein DWQ04_16100 [Chloroflexi bacterium]|nr:MAG: hypothetical protein DWQ04_16100 [Chloroflexota bacterium]
MRWGYIYFFGENDNKGPSTNSVLDNTITIYQLNAIACLFSAAMMATTDTNKERMKKVDLIRSLLISVAAY